MGSPLAVYERVESPWPGRSGTVPRSGMLEKYLRDMIGPMESGHK